MADLKKVFFGSLYEFEPRGVRELIDLHRQGLDDPASAPFITYDRESKLFSCQIEHTDPRQASAFVAQLSAYINTYTRRQESDLTDSPRLRPILYTAGAQHHREERTSRLLDDNLVEPGSSDEEPERWSSFDNITSFWTPKLTALEAHFINTNDIFSVDTIQALSTRTGCQIFVEADRRKIRLVGGAMQSQLALQKLQQLEPLMKLLAVHRARGEVDDNVTILGNRSVAQPRLKFPYLRHSAVSNRIIVQPYLKPLVGRLLVVELQNGVLSQKTSVTRRGEFGISESPALSKIFAAFSTPVLGNVENTLPHTLVAPKTSAVDGIGDSNVPVVLTNRFLGVSENVRVSKWVSQIDPEADANVEPAAPLPELELETTTRRRVLEDSSDEEEEEEEEEEEKKKEEEEQECNSNARELTTPSRCPPPVEAEPRETREPTGNVAIFDTSSDIGNRSCTAPELEAQSSPGHMDGVGNHQDKGKRQLQSMKGANLSSHRNPFDLLGLHTDEGSSSDHERSTESVNVDTTNDVAQITSISSTRHELLDPPAVGLDSPFSTVDVSHEPEYETVRYGRKERATSKRSAAKSRLSLAPDHVHFTPKKSRRQVEDHSATASAASFPHSSRFHQLPMHSSARGKPRQSSQMTASNRNDCLVDVSSSSSSGEPVAPPPGLEYRSQITAAASPEVNLRSRPNGEIPQPAVQRTHSHSTEPRSPSDVMVSSAKVASRDPFVRPLIVSRDTKVLENQRVAELEAQMRQNRINRAVSQNKPQKPAEKIQPVDESRSRKFHHTMYQQAGSPASGTKGKIKLATKSETREQAEARKAKAIADAYGSVASSHTPPRTKNPFNPPEQMSARKMKLLKASDMATEHPEVLKKIALDTATRALFTKMEPLLEATRSFGGELNIEMQLGRTLIVKTARINENDVYQVKDFEQMINPSTQTHTPVLFTNVLTTDGTDVDKILEINAFDQCSVLLEQNSVAQSTRFEFLCCDRNKSQFTISIDQEGCHKIFKSQPTIGKIALHFPGQVWDACLVMSGKSLWTNMPSETTSDVESFVRDLHVSENDGLVAVRYRFPETRSFFVRDVTIRRESCHSCMVPEYTDLAVRLTEVKKLNHTVHPQDKTLCRSQESGYEAMRRLGWVHYEVSIFDTNVDKKVAVHHGLPLGDTTPEASTGKALFPYRSLRAMVELTDHVVSSIDNVGVLNTGTWKRLEEAAEHRQLQMQASLPPHMRTQLGPAVPIDALAVPTNEGPATTIAGGATTVVMGEQRFVPGVRAGTTAELFREGNDVFLYGIGGARIPVLEDDLKNQGINMNLTDAPIVPGDSASQVGERMRIKQALPRQSTKSNPNGEKPKGFW